jgi:hypothetical protein
VTVSTFSHNHHHHHHHVDYHYPNQPDDPPFAAAKASTVKLVTPAGTVNDPDVVND